MGPDEAGPYLESNLWRNRPEATIKRVLSETARVAPNQGLPEKIYAVDESGGYGFFLTKQPTPIDFTGEAGQVRLQAAP
jgi:hypothetical protein